MRFSSKLLTLLAATCAFSKNSKRFNLEDIAAIAKCTAALADYRECEIEIGNINNNLDIVCNTINTEKCQNILNNGIKNVPECNSLPNQVVVPVQLIYRIINSSASLACAKDENGNYCPLSGANIFTTNYKTDEEIIKLLNSTCQSRSCTDKAVDTLMRIETSELLADLAIQTASNSNNNNKQMVNENTEPITLNKAVDLSEIKLTQPQVDMMVKYLKSTNCTVNAPPAVTANTETDDATAIKISFLLIALSLLIALL